MTKKSKKVNVKRKKLTNEERIFQDSLVRSAWRRYRVNSAAYIFASLVLLMSFSAYAETEATKVAKPVPSAKAPSSLASKEGEAKSDTTAKKADLAPAKKIKKNRDVREPFSKFKLPDVNEADDKEPSTSKYLKGRISTITAYGMGIVYGGDPTIGQLESWNNFNSKTKIDGFKKFTDLKEGDTVEINYKQTIKTHKRILARVTLVHKMTKEERAAEEKALMDTPDEPVVPEPVAAVKPVSKGTTNGAGKAL